MPKALFYSICILLSSNSFGQTILLDEDFSNGIPSTWAVVDADGHTPHASMSQFTAGWIFYDDGGDSTAASTSYYTNSTDQSEDYLILPKISLATFTKLSWNGRSVDPSYPDGYHVLVSTTDSLITSFTDTLLTVLTENYNWNRKSIMLDTMGFANQDIFIAFRNFTTNGFILELDDILIEASDFAGEIETAKPTFEVYPNPASDHLNIRFSESFMASIISMDGKIMIQSTETTINTSNLSPGQYIIQLQTKSEVLNQILIIE